MLIKERGKRKNKIVHGSLLCRVFPFTSSAPLSISLYNFFFIFIQKNDSMISAATIFLSFINHLCTRSDESIVITRIS